LVDRAVLEFEASSLEISDPLIEVVTLEVHDRRRHRHRHDALKRQRAVALRADKARVVLISDDLLQAELAVEADRPSKVGDRERDLVQAHTANTSRGGPATLAKRPLARALLARVTGSAFAAGAAPSSSDIETLQAAYTAESLAVYVYSAIVKNFHAFKHPKLENKDYFEAALRNEQDHKALLAQTLGAHTPSGLKFVIPAHVTKTGQSLLNTGVALETAFVEAYLGAAETFSSQELRTVAAKIAANEATHFSFFSAAAGGHGVLASLPASDTIPHTVAKLKPFLA